MFFKQVNNFNNNKSLSGQIIKYAYLKKFLRSFRVLEMSMHTSELISKTLKQQFKDEKLLWTYSSYNVRTEELKWYE